MRKLLGSLCVFTAGGMVWYLRRRERRNRRTLLRDLISALERMETEIRLNQTPLPQLFRGLAQTGDLGAELFHQAAQAVEHGASLPEVWQQAVASLPLSDGDALVLSTLAERLQDEYSNACKAVSLVSQHLHSSLSQLEKQRPEEEKRATALCFSAAALTVILLI